MAQIFRLLDANFHPKVQQKTEALSGSRPSAAALGLPSKTLPLFQPPGWGAKIGGLKQLFTL